MKMKAVAQVGKHMSLDKALQYCGMSKCAWYYAKKPRKIPLDVHITDVVKQVSLRRPAYGTRRMAARVARETDMPINRKKVQRIYRKIGWNEPQKGKNDIIRASRRLKFRPTAPNQLWETDITHIHCGIDGWCYCFNVLDAFTRKWVAYVFDTTANSPHCCSSSA